MTSNYVARDEDEAKLIRTWRPDCDLLIPHDYEEAIEIITECPLPCPYRAVNITFTDYLQESTLSLPTEAQGGGFDIMRSRKPDQDA